MARNKTRTPAGAGDRAASFVFVSYLRTDSVIVEDVVRRLRRTGFDVWWDRDIPASADWDREIYASLEASGAFLSFISAGIAESAWCVKEICRAIERRQALRAEGVDYPIVFVFLDKVPRSAFKGFDSIMKEIETFQYIPFWEHSGITELFFGRLMSADWPASVIRPGCRQRVDALRGGQSPELLKSIFADGDVPFRSYHRHAPEPDRVPGAGNTPAFYRIRPGSQMEPDAAFPVVLDNQWVPPELYDRAHPRYGRTDPALRREFRLRGLADRSGALMAYIARRQRREILRALLHNWQVVINRAAIFNTAALYDWFSREHRDCDALHALVGDDSIVVYLYKESSPVEKPAGFVCNQDCLPAWRRFCLRCPPGQEVACLRMDWTSDGGNSAETGRLLTGRFQNFFLTVVQDRQRLHMLEMAFGIPPEQREAFERRWRRIRERAIQYYYAEGRPYTREIFYKEFLIRENTPVNDAQLRLSGGNARFVPAIKQTVDYLYNLNLPGALGIRPCLPPDTVLTPFLLEEERADLRQLSADQLIYAVDEFQHVFDDDAESACRQFLTGQIPCLDWSDDESGRDDLALDDVRRLRELDEWKTYLRALTNGRRRNRLNEVDYYNIPGIWLRYRNFLERAVGALRGLRWQYRRPALSVIYRFEGLTLTTVYTREGCRMHLPSEEDVGLSGVRERKLAIHIDYVCADVLADGELSPLCDEIRLFEGMTQGVEFIHVRTGQLDDQNRARYEKRTGCLYDRLVGKLRELGFQPDEAR